MCEQNLWIPLTLLEPTLVVAVSAAHLCLGSLQTFYLGLGFKESLFGSHSFTTALCHPSIQRIEIHGNKKSFTLFSFLLLFCLVLPLLHLCVHQTRPKCRWPNGNRKSQTLNWASRWLTTSWSLSLSVCVRMPLCKWSKLCGTEVDKTKWPGIGSNSLLGLRGPCLSDPLHTNNT